MVTVRVSDPEYQVEEPRESLFLDDSSFTALVPVFDISGLAADKVEELQVLLLMKMSDEFDCAKAQMASSLSKLVNQMTAENKPVKVIVNEVFEPEEKMKIRGKGTEVVIVRGSYYLSRGWSDLKRGYFFLLGIDAASTPVVWVVYITQTKVN